MKLGTKFAVADYTLAPQPEVLRRAEVLYDSFMLSKKVCVCSAGLFVRSRTLVFGCRAMALAMVMAARVRARASGRRLQRLRRRTRNLRRRTLRSVAVRSVGMCVCLVCTSGAQRGGHGERSVLQVQGLGSHEGPMHQGWHGQGSAGAHAEEVMSGLVFFSWYVMHFRHLCAGAGRMRLCVQLHVLLSRPW